MTSPAYREARVVYPRGHRRGNDAQSGESGKRIYVVLEFLGARGWRGGGSVILGVQGGGEGILHEGYAVGVDFTIWP